MQYLKSFIAWLAAPVVYWAWLQQLNQIKIFREDLSVSNWKNGTSMLVAMGCGRRRVTWFNFVEYGLIIRRSDYTHSDGHVSEAVIMVWEWTESNDWIPCDSYNSSIIARQLAEIVSSLEYQSA